MESHKNKIKSYLGSHVHCPNWRCGGELYFVENRNEPDGWQCPDIRCDNCYTRWKNMLNELNRKVAKEVKEDLKGEK